MQKQMYYNTNKHKKLRPGLVASYDIWPGNSKGLFLFRHFINLSLTHLLTHLQPQTHRGNSHHRSECVFCWYTRSVQQNSTTNKHTCIVQTSLAVSHPQMHVQYFYCIITQNLHNTDSGFSTVMLAGTVLSLKYF